MRRDPKTWSDTKSSDHAHDFSRDSKIRLVSRPQECWWSGTYLHQLAQRNFRGGLAGRKKKRQKKKFPALFKEISQRSR